MCPHPSNLPIGNKKCLYLEKYYHSKVIIYQTFGILIGWAGGSCDQLKFCSQQQLHWKEKGIRTGPDRAHSLWFNKILSYSSLDFLLSPPASFSSWSPITATLLASLDLQFTTVLLLLLNNLVLRSSRSEISGKWAVWILCHPKHLGGIEASKYSLNRKTWEPVNSVM